MKIRFLRLIGSLSLQSFSLLSLSLLSCVSAAAEEVVASVDTSATPGWVVEQPLPSPATGIEATERIDYLLLDSQYLLKNHDTVRYSRVAAKPNTPAAISEVSEISIEFDPNYQKLTFHGINIVRNGSRIAKLDLAKFKLLQQETELRNSIYSGSWTALYVIDDVRINDIVEYSYSVIGHNPVFGDNYIGTAQLTWPLPIQHRSVRLVTDSGTKLSVRTNRGEATVNHTRTPTEQIYSVLLNNRKMDPEEDRIPVNTYPFDYLQFSEFAAWSDVVNWALPLYSLAANYPELDNHLNERINGLKTLDEKIDASIRFVQDEIRYFGVEFGTNSHKPSQPSDTFSRRYGDCKDKAVLLSYALRRLGLAAHPALVSTDGHDHVATQLPSPLDFNHVIVTYQNAGKIYWVDPTFSEQAGNQRTRSLPPFKKSLVIRKGDKALVDILPSFPSQKDSAVVINEAYSFDNANDAAMSIQVSIDLTGWRADDTRAELRQSTAADFEKSIKDYYQKAFKQTESVSPMTKQDDKAGNRLVLNFSFRAKNPQTDAAARSEYEFYPMIVRDYILRPQVLDRKYSYMPLPSMSIKQITSIQFPAERKIVYLSDEQMSPVNTDFFTLEKSIAKNGQHIGVNLEFISNGKPVEPSNISSYMDSTGFAIENIGIKIWTDKVGTGTTGTKNEQVRSLIEKLKDRK